MPFRAPFCKRTLPQDNKPLLTYYPDFRQCGQHVSGFLVVNLNPGRARGRIASNCMFRSTDVNARRLTYSEVFVVFPPFRGANAFRSPSASFRTHSPREIFGSSESLVSSCSLPSRSGNKKTLLRWKAVMLNGAEPDHTTTKCCTVN